MSELLGKAEIIAMVREHFSQPGAQLAIRPDAIYEEEMVSASCVYRGDFEASSQIRCAFGAIIPDEAYSPDMEGATASGVLQRYPQLLELFEPSLRVESETGYLFGGGFFDELQRTHDQVASSEGGTVEEFLNDLNEFESRELNR